MTMDLTELLADAIAQKASDIFISVNASPLVKVEGKMKPLSPVVLDSEQAHQLIYSVLTDREIAVFEDAKSFEIALKNALREAPDVILIGELRDQETMKRAIAYSETGHLCLATLHANNANQAIDRVLTNRCIGSLHHAARPTTICLSTKSIASCRICSELFRSAGDHNCISDLRCSRPIALKFSA